MSRTVAVIIAGLYLALASPALAADDGLSAEMKFAKAVKKFKPVDEGTTFEPSRVYAWTLIKGGKGSFKVTHVWYKNDKKVFKHEINIRGAKYPTWSFVNATAGSYKVEVQDETGKVIETGTFTVAKK
jgi:hypothetical protein